MEPDTPDTRPAKRPTVEIYADWQQAFDHFNQRLWDGALPDCIITLRQHANSYGYFSKQRFLSADGHSLVDEIAINPGYLPLRPLIVSLSTLAHEMAHGWQAHFGTESRKSYHNAQWAAEMERIGLCPSATGLPGGRRTGQQMTHYVIDGGLFAQVVQELIDTGWKPSWMDRILAMEPEHYQTYLAKLAAGQLEGDDTGEGGEEREVTTGEGGSGTGGASTGEPNQTGTTETGSVSKDPSANDTTAEPAEPEEKKKAGRPKRAAPAAYALTTATPLSAMPMKTAVVPGNGSEVEQAATTGEPAAITNTFVRPSQRTGAGNVSGSNRSKFICPDCSAAAWGKPTLKLICGECEQPMAAK